jgi:hypothetical protein
MTPVASAPPKAAGPPWELSPQAGPVPGESEPVPGPDGAYKGLPRRVKQASLAPQLKASPPARGAASGGPSPAEIRKTMSALQRGWQEGRSQQTPGSPGLDSGGSPGLGPAGADSAPDSTAD